MLGCVTAPTAPAQPTLFVWHTESEPDVVVACDQVMVSTLAARGRGLAGGLNAYFNGHALKVQLDWTHAFGDDLGRGPHTIRLQLDASF